MEMRADAPRVQLQHNILFSGPRGRPVTGAEPLPDRGHLRPFTSASREMITDRLVAADTLHRGATGGPVTALGRAVFGLQGVDVT